MKHIFRFFGWRQTNSSAKRLGRLRRRIGLSRLKIWHSRHLHTKRQRVMAGFMALAVLAGIIIPIAMQLRQAQAATWWSPSWTKRRQITFNNSASTDDLVNFPVRVSLSSSNVDYANTQNSGQDLRFTDSDGVTALSYEIEKWDEAGTSEVWVKVPQIDAGSTTDSIYMYYGNSTAAAGQSANSVWDSNYRAVWHMPNATTTTMTNSVSGGTTITKRAATEPNQTTSGQIGNAQSYDGTNDYASSATTNLTGSNVLTVSMWLNTTAHNSNNGLALESSANTNNNDGAFYINPDSNTGTLQVLMRGGTGFRQEDFTRQTNGAFHNLTFVLDQSTVAGEITGYIDGSPASSTLSLNTKNAATTFRNDILYFMSRGNASLFADGVQDEVRISNGARSASWINAEYRSGANTMNTFGSESTGTYYPDGSWMFRRKIMLNNATSSGSLSAFPIRVSLNSGNINYNYTQDAGQDIRFVDDDDSTSLAYEIEKWDESGTSEVWVRVTTIAATNSDFIYMYYGNTRAVNAQAATTVWSSSYNAVWHLGQTGTGAANEFTNSTSTSANGRGGGGTAANVPTRTNGMIGYGQNFDGVSDYINTTNTTIFDHTVAFTMEAWINPNSCGETNAGEILEKATRLALYICSESGASPNRLALIFQSNSAGSTVNSLRMGAWRHVAMVYDGSGTATFYINGVNVTSVSSVTESASGSGAMYIGSDATQAYTFDGAIDEPRVAQTARNADWINASYRSSANLMTTFGKEEVHSASMSNYWYDSCYQYRRKITINNAASAEALTNFPIRVALDTTKVDYYKTQDAGQDIRFTDSNGLTPLSYEIENWNESGTSDIWVKVPQIDAASTTDSIYMYYGCSTATDGQNKTNVWSNNYRAVYHMGESGASNLDSTSGASNTTKRASGEPAQTSSGMIANAQLFDGTNDYSRVADAGTSQLDINNTGTVSAWTKRNATALWQSLLSKGTANNNGQHNYGLQFQGNDAGGNSYRIHFMTGNGTNSTDLLSANTYNDTTNSYAIAGSWDGTTMRLYVNGTQENTITQNFVATPNDGDFRIGEFGGNANPYNGIIDEVRVASVTRSADWLEAEYLTGTNAINAIAVEETMPVAVSDAWCTAGTSCNASWTVRRQVGFANGGASENLTDFPVLIKLSAALGNIDYSRTQDSGQDLRFVDSADPTVILPHEIETWNEAGESFVWVKVPQINASSADYIWMYYGNASAASSAQPSSVWESNYKSVWHMDNAYAQNGGVDLPNSTATGPVITKRNSTNPTAATGKAGGALTYNGTNDYTYTGSTIDLTSANYLTVSMWLNWTSFANDDDLLLENSANANSNTNALFIDPNAGGASAGNFQAALHGSGSGNYREEDFPRPVGGGMRHYSFVFDHSTTAGDIKMYIDGVEQSSSIVLNTKNTTGSFGDYTFYMMSRNISSLFGAGTLDEVKLSTANRSDSWNVAEFQSGNNAFTTFGPQDGPGLEAPTLTPLTGSVSTTPTFQLRAADYVDPGYLRYKIDVCSDATCNTVVRTIDQTASQTGWSGQDSQTSTAYAASATLASSTLASHTYQAPALSAATTYYWRGYAIDPGGTGEWSAASAISSFTTAAPAATPTLVEPANGATGVPVNPVFKLWTTDLNSDYVRYRIEVCSNSDCSTVLRNISQTSSQTGWLGQNAGSGTAYTTGQTLNALTSQQGMHAYQNTALTAGTTYYWRAYAIDPAGNNTESAASSIWSFTTRANAERITGGTTIRGGTTIGN